MPPNGWLIAITSLSSQWTGASSQMILEQLLICSCITSLMPMSMATELHHFLGWRIRETMSVLLLSWARPGLLLYSKQQFLNCCCPGCPGGQEPEEGVAAGSIPISILDREHNFI